MRASMSHFRSGTSRYEEASSSRSRPLGLVLEEAAEGQGAERSLSTSLGQARGEFFLPFNFLKQLKQPVC